MFDDFYKFTVWQLDEMIELRNLPGTRQKTISPYCNYSQEIGQVTDDSDLDTDLLLVIQA